MSKKCGCFVLLMMMLSVVNTLQAASYFIGLNGNDSNSGTSPEQAWNSIARVNTVNFEPGDSILFEGGQLFFGSLRFDHHDHGTAVSPITIGSYGRGRAIIDSGQEHGLYGDNCAGFVVQDLVFIGAGRTIKANFSGIFFSKDTLADEHLKFYQIDNVDVSGYPEAGIYFKGGNNSNKGFKDIRITRSIVHDNGDKGICIWSSYNTLTQPDWWPHQDVYIAYCKAYNNSGIAGNKGHTGNGIVISQVNRGIIEHCEAYNNGWLCDDPNSGGPIGIWTWDSKDVVIQFCESHHNKTNNGKDGGGFDIDGGCINCIMQYNYSHDNYAAGYGIYQFKGAREFKNNIVRYNISENDGLISGYGGINFWATNSSGGIKNTMVYHNTIYVSSNTRGAAIVDFPDDAIHSYIYGTKIFNNIFVTASGKKVIDIPKPSNEWVFKGNCYYSYGDQIAIAWDGKTYTSLAAWRNATGQEMLNGDPVGFEADPKLIEPGSGGTIGDPTRLGTLSTYKLQPNSPLIDKALNLKLLFKIDPGSRDFYGTALPQFSGYDIGACEATNK